MGIEVLLWILKTIEDSLFILVRFIHKESQYFKYFIYIKIKKEALFWISIWYHSSMHHQSKRNSPHKSLCTLVIQNTIQACIIKAREIPLIKVYALLLVIQNVRVNSCTKSSRSVKLVTKSVGRLLVGACAPGCRIQAILWDRVWIFLKVLSLSVW